jgi:hypothetical protein
VKDISTCLERALIIASMTMSGFWQRKINAPGSALFQEILLNVVRRTPIRSFAGDSDAKTLKSNELRLPTETQLIKASYDIHDAVLFSYKFFNENWEGLVIRR